MTVWKSFGASVIGPSHITTSKPNQDAWVSFHRVWADGIVVSDGLGSKSFSDFGSKAACNAVVLAAKAFQRKTKLENTFLYNQIKNNWLALISPFEPSDCAATCLFAFRLDDGIFRIGMLGDGLAAAVKADGVVLSLTDEKEEGFSNITVALSSRVTEEDWRWLCIPEGECSSIVLCTDGVADDLTDIHGFIKEFACAYCNLSTVSAARRTREILENWPTPKHSDDKTIACLFREEVADE